MLKHTQTTKSSSNSEMLYTSKCVLRWMDKQQKIKIKRNRRKKVMKRIHTHTHKQKPKKKKKKDKQTNKKQTSWCTYYK